MSSIKILDLEKNNSSYLSEISSDELELTRGGWFLVVVGAAWLGYEIAKEAKTNWFN